MIYEWFIVADAGRGRRSGGDLNVTGGGRFYRLIPSVVVVIGYCVSFWALSQVVRMMPLGIAYAIWSGMGIVIVSAAAYFIYHQKLDLPAVIGMALIIAGVLVINLFSKSSVH